MKKNKENTKTIHKPRLYWFYVTYLVCVCIISLVLSILLLEALYLTDRILPHASGTFLLLCFSTVTLLWISTLLYAICLKKELFYRKWLKQSLMVFFLTCIAMTTIMAITIRLYQAKYSEPTVGISEDCANWNEMLQICCQLPGCQEYASNPTIIY